MRPAFSSTKQAAAFALLLLVVLLSPVLAGKKLLPPKEETYSSQGWKSGPYPWIRHEIFEETNDIDIAFLGSSHIFNAINTPYVQARLTEKLGRPAIVRTLAWGGSGYDVLYLITQDLLTHRHVRLLVFYDENSGLRSPMVPTLFRFGDNSPALAGLSPPEQGLFYFAAVVGMPRNLLCLLRPNLPAPLVTDETNYWESAVNGGNPATQLGCLRVRRGFALDPLVTFVPLEPFIPATSVGPADTLIYSANTETDFKFSPVPLPAWQTHFARKFAELTREHGVKTVMLYLPVLAEARATSIPERAFWPEVLDGTTLLGMPPAKLFGTLTDAEVHKIYADPQHFNQNGQDYFTLLVTPALLDIYEAATNR